MRSKAPLVLMEQMVMILVFALASALCLQAFARSDEISQESTMRDLAVLQAQSAAGCIQLYGFDSGLDAFYGGDTDAGAQDVRTFHYSETMAECAQEEARILLTATRLDSGVPGLGLAGIAVTTADGLALCELEVGWQEAMDGEEVDDNG